MMQRFGHIVENRQGSAGEFALVLPLMLIFLLGIIDVGRLMWEWNQAEKATQMGVRYAVATDLVPSDLIDHSFAIGGGDSGSTLQGQPVPPTEFPGVSCQDNGSVACSYMASGSYGFALTANAAAFGRIVNKISDFKPDVAATNVVIDYANSGLGFAGDPNGPDVAPLVTVRLQNLDFQPLLTQIFGATVTLPDFSAALTLEDGDGTFSN